MATISCLCSYPPVGWRCSVQSLPIDTGGEPLPLGGGEGAHRCVGAGPGEVTAMQAPLTEPDAGAIPDQELDAVLPSVAEGVGATVTRRLTQALLHGEGQAVYPQTHVDGFDG